MPVSRTTDSAGDLSPSLRHFLMVGHGPERLAPARLPGWFPLLELIATDDGLRNVWNEHRETLIAEARAHGFTPAAVVWFDVGPEPEYVDDTDAYVMPSTPARDRWSEKFCREHKY